MHIGAKARDHLIIRREEGERRLVSYMYSCTDGKAEIALHQLHVLLNTYHCCRLLVAVSLLPCTQLPTNTPSLFFSIFPIENSRERETYTL